LVDRLDTAVDARGLNTGEGRRTARRQRSGAGRLAAGVGAVAGNVRAQVLQGERTGEAQRERGARGLRDARARAVANVVTRVRSDVLRLVVADVISGMRRKGNRLADIDRLVVPDVIAGMRSNVGADGHRLADADALVVASVVAVVLVIGVITISLVASVVTVVLVKPRLLAACLVRGAALARLIRILDVSHRDARNRQPEGKRGR